MASETEETTSLEAWEAKLEKEIQDDSRNGVESSVPSILRDLLRSYPQDGQQAAQDAARRINFDYRDKYLPSDPLLKGRDDEGMAGFLYHLYLLSLDTARLIHYSSPEQDALVQLFVELRKLPPEQFKIAGEDCLVYKDEPVFGITVEDSWNKHCPSMASAQGGEGQAATAEFKDDCDKWVNFSAFLARCTEAGLFDTFEYKFKYADFDIELGLEQDLPPGDLGNCRLVVALQWISVAGEVIFASMIERNENMWNSERWRLWARKIADIETVKQHEEIHSMVSSALAQMVSIDPDALSTA